MRKQSIFRSAGAVSAAWYLFLLGAAAGLLPLGCANQTPAYSALSVLAWNVEALFDGHDDGTEYAEYRAAQGWGEEKFRSRLTAIAKAVGQMKNGPPDVAVFIELENEGVLDLLSEKYLAEAGYRQGYFAKKDGQALGTGVLSRFPVTKMLSHGYFRDGKSIPRPVSEVWIEADGEEIVILVCHWKSKQGKPEESRVLRDNAAVLVRRISGDIRAEREAGGKPAVPILLAGDFNQTAAEFFDGGFPFPVTRDHEDFHQIRPGMDAPLFWMPWGTELDGGSYYYKSAWESIDHFFLSGAFFDGNGWDYRGVEVLSGTPWTGNNGIPQSYNPRTGNGLSDHLPLLLTLTLNRTGNASRSAK
jgi:endonuclease/exonuclease/phosphatase family metal-dependent hydrolase